MAEDEEGANFNLRIQTEIMQSLRHEMLTHIDTLSMSINILRKIGNQKEKYLSEDYFEVTDAMEFSVKALQNSVSDIQGLFRPEDGKSQKIAVLKLIEDSLNPLRNRIKRSGITVNIKGDTGLHVEGHPAELNMLFQNLLLNSLASLRQGTKKGKYLIEILCGRKGKNLNISIIDNGPSVGAFNLKNNDRNFYNNIFEAGYSGKQNSSNHGAGYGLFLARRVAERHHGKMNVEVTKNFIVNVTLPLAQTDEND